EEAVDVDDGYRSEIEAEALPGDGFEELFERAATAGEGDHGVGEFQHHALALVYVVDDAQFGKRTVAPFQVVHKAREDADHSAARFERRDRKAAHRAQRAAAVD